MPVTVRFDPSVVSQQSQVIPDATPASDGIMSKAQAAKLATVTPGGSSLNSISLIPGPPPLGDTIEITASLFGVTGDPLGATLVTVESFAQVDGRGLITTNTGTEIMNTGVPAGLLSSAVIRSHTDGTLQFTITDQHGSGDTVVVRVMIDNAPPAFIELHWPGL